MSELTPLVVVFVLPLAAAALLYKLGQNIGTSVTLSNKKYNWPCTIEREELLLKNYNNELLKHTNSMPPLLHNKPDATLRMQENHLKAMLGSINKIDIMSEILNHKYTDQFKELQSEIDKICEFDKSQITPQKTYELLKNAESQLRDLTVKAHSQLSEIETDTTSEIVAGTMKSLGYDIKNRGSLFAGSLGKTSIRANVLSGGRIVLDTTSYKGLSCHKEVARFETKLKENGIFVKRLHNSEFMRRGGVLLKDPFPICTENKQATSNQTAKKSTLDYQNNYLLTQTLLQQKLREI